LSDFILSQIIATVALVFDLSSVQMKKREHLILGQAVAASLIAAHFFVLGHNTAGAMFAVGCIRLLVSLRWQNLPVQILAYSFIILAAAYTYQNYLSIIGCGASLLMAIGAFSSSLRRLRLFFIAGSSTWLIHNTLIWTPVGIGMEALFLCSNLLGFYRFFIRKTPLDSSGTSSPSVDQ
jgi:Bacterial inner membrane protein